MILAPAAVERHRGNSRRLGPLLFRPDFRLHFDRSATARLAAGRTAQRTGLPGTLPKAAEPDPVTLPSVGPPQPGANRLAMLMLIGGVTVSGAALAETAPAAAASTPVARAASSLGLDPPSDRGVWGN